MKKFIEKVSQCLTIITIVLLTNSANAQTKKDTTQKVSTITESFSVTDMGCSTDSKMVETALYRKKGVKKVKITNEIVAITYDPLKVKREELITVIENTGTCEDANAKVHKVKFKTP